MEAKRLKFGDAWHCGLDGQTLFTHAEVRLLIEAAVERAKTRQPWFDFAWELTETPQEFRAVVFSVGYSS